MCNWSQSVLTLIGYLSEQYPILEISRLGIQRPIALVVPDARYFQTVIRILNPQTILDGSAKEVQMLAEVRKASIYPVVIAGCNRDSISRREQEKMNLLIDVARIARVDGKELRTQIVFLFDRRVPAQYENDFLQIYLEDVDKVDPNEALPFKSIIPTGVTFDSATMRKLLNECDATGESKAFIIAIRIASMFDDSIDFDMMENIARKVVDFDEANHDRGEVDSMFIDLLYGMAESGKFRAVYHLPNLSTRAIDDLDAALYTDGQYLFISSDLFRDLLTKLTDVFSIDAIKLSLSEAGILNSQGGRFVSKMLFYTSYGESKRIWMHRFCLEKLNKLGELPLIEFCALYAEEVKEG